MPCSTYSKLRLKKEIYNNLILKLELLIIADYVELIIVELNYSCYNMNTARRFLISFKLTKNRLFW